MKITANGVHVRLEAENPYETFQIGQISMDMRKADLKLNVMVGKESQASLTILEEQFISYLIHKVET